jgi:hypothetical protein
MARTKRSVSVPVAPPKPEVSTTYCFRKIYQLSFAKFCNFLNISTLISSLSTGILRKGGNLSYSENSGLANTIFRIREGPLFYEKSWYINCICITDFTDFTEQNLPTIHFTDSENSSPKQNWVAAL